MTDYRVERAEALDDHRLRVRWNDGLEAIVDLAETIRPNGFFAPLADPALFADVRVYEFGHTIYWRAEDGSEIDICPDVLRAKADPRVAAWIAEEEAGWNARQAAE